MICVWPVVDDIVMPAVPGPGRSARSGTSATASLWSLATERYLAADALEAIEVDYEPLPAVLDMEAALADGVAAGARIGRHQPVLHQALRLRRLRGRRRPSADVVVKRRYINQRLIPIADGDRGPWSRHPMGTSGELTLWTVHADPARRPGAAWR